MHVRMQVYRRQLVGTLGGDVKPSQEVDERTLLIGGLSDPRLRIITTRVTTRVGVVVVAFSINRKFVIPQSVGWLTFDELAILRNQRCIDGDTQVMGGRLFSHDAVSRIKFCDATIMAELGLGFVPTWTTYDLVMRGLIAEFKAHFPGFGKPFVRRIERRPKPRTQH